MIDQQFEKYREKDKIEKTKLEKTERKWGFKIQILIFELEKWNNKG